MKQKMRKLLFILFGLILLFGQVLLGNIINIPDDYPTIQEGIDAASGGDTVLVQPGTYVENINYNGKNITVASLFLTTGDTTYISQTLIDGNQNGSVVEFSNGEENTSILSGFIITNGNAYISDRTGGIYCYNSSPTITDNIINNNIGGPGGGISCIVNSNPIIANNTISNNYATSICETNFGGGIYCFSSSPTILNTIISNNIVEWGSGGGICCTNSSPIIINCVINNNGFGVGGNGGGIDCSSNSFPSLFNVTISENSACYGGGVYCWNSSSPTLLNCILWNDTPQEIYFFQYDDPNTITISYSDIQGDSAGIVTNDNGTVNWLEGNIDENPLFVDPLNGDYHLTWANFPIPDSTMSPCIDAGNPDPQYNDPDGTRNDMGAFYFDQSIIELSSFTASYVDDYILICWTTAWETDVMGFNIYRSEYNDLSTTGNHINCSLIPGHGTTSEPHNYEFADATADVDSTYYYWLEVISIGGLSYIYGSIVYEPPFGVDECITSNTFYLYQNYPNPFRTSTLISFSLKEKSHVKLSVYNLKGQLLETLVDDFKLAGSHTVEWDSEDISSGIYFYKLSTKDKTFIRKMILLK